MSNVDVEYGFRGIMRELFSYKSAVFSVIILLFLIMLSIYAIVFIPYNKAIELWRAGEDTWIRNPRNAPPEWWEIFVGKKLPRTIDISAKTMGSGYDKKVLQENNFKKIIIIFTFDYLYDDTPSAISIFFNAKFKKNPTVRIIWIKPDNKPIFLKNYTISSPTDRYYLDQDYKLLSIIHQLYIKQLGTLPDYSVTIERGLFTEYAQEFKVMKGKYTVRIEAEVSEEEDLNAELIVYGKVYGIAGTDHLRRPLEIALIWGTPVALAFGLTASLITTLLQLIIATISGWYGGIIDSIIQRITEIYMVLPFLPFLILISTFYRLDIWVLLAAVIILSIFGGGVKTTRALVMQVKNYPYIEAALAYGASGKRIIFLYIIPKIFPPVIPGLIQSVPAYVFLEAALAFLGLGDPFLPTWGKVINDAFSNGALYKGFYYWVIEPSFMLILTALAFASLGFALDKIVNPKLKEI